MVTCMILDPSLDWHLPDSAPNTIADELDVGYLLSTTHFPTNLPRARMGKW